MVFFYMVSEHEGEFLNSFVFNIDVVALPVLKFLIHDLGVGDEGLDF